MRHNSLSKATFHGTSEGGQRLGRQRKGWMDEVKEWMSSPMPRDGLPQKKTGRGSLMNRPSCPPDDPSGQRTGLN